MHHCLPTYNHEIRKRHPASDKCNVKLKKSSRLRSYGQSNEILSVDVWYKRPLPSGNCLLIYIIRITFWLSDTCRVTRAISRGKPSYRERMKNIVACHKVEQSALKTDLRSVRKQWVEASTSRKEIKAARKSTRSKRILDHLNIQLDWRIRPDLYLACVDLILFFVRSSLTAQYIISSGG